MIRLSSLGVVAVLVFRAVWMAAGNHQEDPVTREQQRRLLLEEEAENDAPSWQRFPVTHYPDQRLPTSSIHCIGDNFNASTSWQYRSCALTHLCWDVAAAHFVVLPSAAEARLVQALSSSSSARSSTVTISTLLSESHSAMSLGVLLHDDDDDNHHPHMPWFPEVIDPDQARQQYPKGYHQLPNHVVWIPWEPTVHATRHWLWTNWWPLFVVGTLFYGDDEESWTNRRQFVPVVVTTQKLSAAQQAVVHDLGQYWEPLQIHSSDSHNNDVAAPSLVCTRHAVAGIGRLAPTLGQTDSIGHGVALQSFARHVKSKLGVPETTTPARREAVQWITNMPEGWDGSAAQQRVHAAFSSLQDVAPLELRQQAQVMSTANALIMTLSHACWGPVLVPDHTLVMVLYRGSDEMNKYVDCVYVLNNAAFLQVKWIDLIKPDAGLSQVERALASVAIA